MERKLKRVKQRQPSARVDKGYIELNFAASALFGDSEYAAIRQVGNELVITPIDDVVSVHRCFRPRPNCIRLFGVQIAANPNERVQFRWNEMDERLEVAATKPVLATSQPQGAIAGPSVVLRDVTEVPNA